MRSLKGFLQRLLGVNEREATAVVLIAGLLGVGAVYRTLLQPRVGLEPSQLQSLLDSLAQVQSVAAVAGAQQQDAPGDTQRVRPRRKAEPTEPININTASKAELMTLPGVGEVIAERILEYRRTKRFETPEELMEVKGIGPKKFERLRPYIRVR